MSLSTYAALQTAVPDWLIRDDLSSERVQDFIRLAEAQMDLRLRSREMRASVTVNVAEDGDTIAIPSDYLEMIQIQPTGTWVDDGGVVVTESRSFRPLTVVSFNDLRTAGVQVPGQPGFYAEIPDGSAWQLYPMGANYTVTVWYYARVPALSDTNTTNSILSAQPDLYLAGAIAEGEDYLKIPQNERGTWRQRFNAIVDELNAGARRVPYTGATPIMRAAYGNR